VNLVQLCAFLVVLSKPEIGDLVCFVLDEYVSRLEVSVDNRMLMQIFVSADELLDDYDGFSFW
jgi:hypothetical protein